MDSFSFDTLSWLGVALMLGLKHGLDADHLAAIDGLSRLHAAVGRPRLARCSGLLFASGHGSVVLLAAWLLEGHAAELPAWLNQAGNWISIALLTGLGLVNLRQALAVHGGRGTGRPAGFIAPWLLRLPLTSRPGGAIVIGALFAISFDTLAIASWFGVTAAQRGNGAVLLMAGAFAAGMVASDATNGWFVACMLQRSQTAHRRAARGFQIAVASLALTVAAINALRATSPVVDNWAEGRELWFGIGIVVAVTLGYAWTMRSAPSRYSASIASVDGRYRSDAAELPLA